MWAMKMANLILASLLLLTLLCTKVQSFQNLQSQLSLKVRRSVASMIAENEFSSYSNYIRYLSSIAQLPKGFSVGTTGFLFEPFEVANKYLKMNLTLILADKPTSSYAAMFTSNQFCGGPVIVGKKRTRNSGSLQAIIVNNKISNVCPGGVQDGGESDSETVCEGLAKAFGLSSKDLVLPSSTGIIGWRLPVNAITSAIPELTSNIQSNSMLPAAIGIMTTDRYPKLRAFRGTGWSIVGIAKGAGMIGLFTVRTNL
jgi:glutamate N-acetyltransferase/amino-acid N-acetyltransferase